MYVLENILSEEDELEYFENKVLFDFFLIVFSSNS